MNSEYTVIFFTCHFILDYDEFKTITRGFGDKLTIKAD